MGVSLVMHPRNPYCPTSHMNVRCFIANKEGEDPVWWFGGGIFFDDINEGGFERCFALTQSVGDSFTEAYLPICTNRREAPYGEHERDFQTKLGAQLD
jgi:coproporphyrinogen III oxidase